MDARDFGHQRVVRQIKRELPFIARHLPQAPRDFLKYIQHTAESSEYLNRIWQLETRLIQQEQKVKTMACLWTWSWFSIYIFIQKIFDCVFSCAIIIEICA